MQVGMDSREQPKAPDLPGQPGASALREYERRHKRREQHAREKLGGLGVFLARVIDEPSSTKVWKQGGQGEVRTAERLEKHLSGIGIRLLHDRQIPGHGHANIDHLAVGPGGITVIDSKTHRGKVKVDRVGGLFAPRKTVLLINGRDRTNLVDGVNRQIGYIRSALDGFGDGNVEIRGALCFPNVDGLPLLSQLAVDDVVIDGPKPIAKLAKRPGLLQPDAVNRLCEELGRRFPPA
jgi:Nuclease-related domain